MANTHPTEGILKNFMNCIKKRTNCCSDGRLLCCVIYHKLTRTFRRNVLPPSSGLKELYQSPSEVFRGCGGSVI